MGAVQCVPYPSRGLASQEMCDAVPVVLLAQMSAAVYDLHKSEKIDQKKFPELAHSGFKIPENQSKQQDCYYPGKDFDPAWAVWVRGKQAVLAIKGTDPGSVTDVAADARSIVGGLLPVHATRVLLQKVREFRAQGYTVLVTGHSLGGYIGEIVSTHGNVPGCVFCAPGPNSPINTHTGEHENPNFHNINAAHDPFGNVAPGYFSHKQWSIYIEGLWHHGIGEMIEELKKRGNDVTNANVVSKHCTSSWNGYWLK